MKLSETAQRKYRRTLIRAVCLPLVLALGLTAMLAWQIRRLIDANHVVEHSDLVIERTYRLEKLIIDMETGLRGFLIAGQTDFLEPYHDARPVIDDSFNTLIADVQDNAEQQERLLDARATLAEWDRYAASLIVLRAEGGDYTSVVSTAQGKALMDRIRVHLDTIVDVEHYLRDSRSRESEATARRVLLWSAGLALTIGALLAWFGRREIVDLARSYGRAEREARSLAEGLERRVAERTVQLEASNKELEAFSYSVSHDLRAPLRALDGFSRILLEEFGTVMSGDGREYLCLIRENAQRMGQLIDDLLRLSRVSRQSLKTVRVDPTTLARQALAELRTEPRQRKVEVAIEELPPCQADPALLKQVFTNLLSNSFKYTGHRDHATIEVGSRAASDGVKEVVYFVKDNGVGFDMRYANKLFGVFQRLHRAEDYEGTGVGLAIVQRVIARHGGRIWAEAEVDRGATFFFSLGDAGGNE